MNSTVNDFHMMGNGNLLGKALPLLFYIIYVIVY